MKNILEIFDFDNKTSSALNYYILDGCRGEYEQLTVVQDLLVSLDEGTQATKDLAALVEANQEDFEAVCGGEPGSLDPLLVTLALAIESFDEVKSIGDSATNLLECEDINAIWVDIVHDAFCTSAPSAFNWMFASVTAVYSSGIMIYLIRGALLPTVDLQRFDEYDDEDSAYTEEDEFT